MRSSCEDEELVGNSFSSSIVQIHKEVNGDILRLPRLMTATVVKEPDKPVGLMLKLKRLTAHTASPSDANDKKSERPKQQSTSFRDSSVVVSELLPDSPFSSILWP